LENIEISFYGLRKSSYETVTRKSGSFENAWKGINPLLEKKVPFVVKSALLPANREELEEFEAWASTIPWMNGLPPSFSMFFDLRCRRDSEIKNKLIKKLRLSPEDGLKVLTRRRKKYFMEKKEFFSKFLSPPNDKLFSCGAGIGSGCVDAYGYFQPCIMLRHPDTIYDLKKGFLKDAMKNFFPKVRQLKAKNPTYLERCARCFLWDFCEQCPAKSWIENGNLDTPVEYLCEITHIQARFLGLIEKGELTWEIRNWNERLGEFYRKVSESKF
jgi:radical SAM protein with 4Fe4S-binding SPASM domain